MNRTADNKRPIEQILVVKAGATTVQSGGEAFTTAATGDVNLTDGEIRVFSSNGFGTVANNTAIAPSDTVTAAPEVFVALGNTALTEKHPLTTRPYEKSANINGNSKIIYNYRAAQRPTYDTWTVGAAVGATGAINLEDETEYVLRIAFFGRDMDEAYAAHHKPPSYTANYVSKDYTTLGHTDAEATDDIIQQLAYNINLNASVLKFNKPSTASRKPMVAFAVDSTGANGVSIKSLKPGTFIPVLNSSIGLRGITATWDIIKSFENSTLTSSATVVPIDLTLAGNAAAAGTALTSPSGGNYSNGFEGVLTLTGNAGNTETVTVGTKVYTFQTTLTNVDGNVLIGATAAASIQNLVNAINLGPGAGTAYAAATVAQPETIRAREGAGDTMVVNGSAASASTETLTNGSWGAANLAAVNRVSGKADHLMLMAVDRTPTFEDRIPYLKTRLQVGLIDGFNETTVTVTNVQDSSEGEGTSRQWEIFYDNTHRQRQYDQYRGFEDLKIRYDNPIIDGTFYDAVNVEHYHADLIGTDTIVKPFKLIILIPNAESSDNGDLTVDANGASAVTTVLLPWINSTNWPVVSVR